MKKSIKRQNFTLIEMLVVIGIAGLLFTLMGPAFSRMTRGNAVESLASGLKLGMERARALAVSQRRSVAVLLPNKVSDKEKAHYNFQRGGFLLGFVTQNNSGDYVFDGVIPDADWYLNATLLQIP